jgi:uncharacterized protein (TIGR04255 family)
VRFAGIVVSMDKPPALPRYTNGPLYEAGLNLVFAEPTLVDPYDIRSLHDRFRDELPLVERQLPASVDGKPISVSKPEEDHQRWFFVSEDGRSLAQFQANLIGRNWRRQALPPGGDLSNYPGFTRLVAAFSDQFSKLESYLQMQGKSLPATHVAELFYDNFIPIGEGVKIKDVLRAVQIPYSSPVSDLVCTWKEGLVGEVSDTSYLRIDMRVLGAANEEGAEPLPFIRLRLMARDSVSSFKQALTFYEQAHSLTRTRLESLTTEACRATW